MKFQSNFINHGKIYHNKKLLIKCKRRKKKGRKINGTKNNYHLQEWKEKK